MQHLAQVSYHEKQEYQLMLGLNRICEDIGGFKFGGLVQEDVDRLMFQFDS